MAATVGMCFGGVLLFVIFNVISAQLITAEDKDQQFCSFFNNRKPKTQPGLKNCTWFKEKSCCQQQEIKATFGRMKPLKGASVECQKYINYLMCYICAPNQNIFYRQERLTVCVDFCDKLYDACRSAILKGSIIGKLYESGEEFCHSRRFQVETKDCFSFDEKLDASSGVHVQTNRNLVLLIATLCVLFRWPATEVKMLFYPRKDEKKSKGKQNKHDGDEITKQDEIQDSTGVKQEENVELDGLQIENTGLEMSQGWPALSSKQFQPAASKQQCTRNRRPVANATPTGSTMPLYNRSVTLPLWLEKSFIALLLFILHIHLGHAELTKDNIKMWAELISADLTDVARKGLRHEEIQRLYEKAQYATEYINGTTKVLEVREKLGMSN